MAGTAVVGSFNTRLAAARSRHLEAGLKWVPARGARVDLAAFRIDTQDEIVSVLSTGGRTAYANATQTRREGLELALRRDWSAHWRGLASASVMRATYDQAFGAVPAGNRLPGVPARQAFASLQWSQGGFSAGASRPAQGAEVALDLVARSRLWANDANTASAAGYGLLNLRLRQRWQAGPAHLEAFAGLDNLADRRTVGSVIVNQATGGYYEPGLPRTWLLGVQARVPL